MKHINIIFAGEMETPDLHFIEIEDDNGNSISVGEWSDYGGLSFGRKLRIPIGGEGE